MNYKKTIFLFAQSTFLVMLVIITSCNGQTATNEPGFEPSANMSNEIRWISFEDAVDKAGQEPKKLFIDVYTNWCGWCKKMDATTFREAEVVKYINENFYAIKLNAETRDTIRFRDKEFKFIPEYKANELAISLLNGKMGYPSYVLLDEKFTMMTPPVQSYMTKESLMPILIYFGDGIFQNQSWEDYEATLKK